MHRVYPKTKNNVPHKTWQTTELQSFSTKPSRKTYRNEHTQYKSWTHQQDGWFSTDVTPLNTPYKSPPYNPLATKI